MISGVHTIIYSKDAEADKVFFRDVLKFNHVDIGHGWLIFALPPSELAFHPTDENEHHEIYLICDDINKFMQQMQEHNIICSSIQNERWGDVVQITLPGGSNIGVYQPKHARP